MSRHPFDLLMELETPDIRLDCAALHLARDVYPSLNIKHYLHTLDELAREVAERRPGLAANLRYEAMRSVLVERHRFNGANQRHAPEHLYLNSVLDAGVGIPISLSVVWLEVARRLKWPVGGVALPGNFVVRFDDPERFVLAHPSQDGRTLSLEDCTLLVAERCEKRVPITPAQLRPVDTRAILLRLLRSLRDAYLARCEWRQLANVLQRMHAVAPDQGVHLQELAAVRVRQGDLRRAAACLQAYLDGAPRGNAARIARSNLRQLQAALLARN